MTKYKDARSNIEELKNKENKKWLDKICEFTLSDISKTDLQENEKKHLEKLFWDEKVTNENLPQKNNSENKDIVASLL